MWVTPSLHPEVPGIQFVSPGYGLDIRQSNQWAGRRCVTPHVRGFGCLRVTPELVCFLRILTPSGWDGSLGVHTRLPGLRQGTTVCVHMRMDMEQQSDHKLITPSGMGLLVCGAGSHPSCLPGVQEGMFQRSEPEPVLLFRISIPWHSDNESLFGPPNQPKLKVPFGGVPGSSRIE